MCPDRGVLADKCTIDEGLVLEQRVEGVEHVTLVVVPPEGVVLCARHVVLVPGGVLDV